MNSYVAYYQYFKNNLEKLYLISVSIILLSFLLDIILHLNEFSHETILLLISAILLISFFFFLVQRETISCQNSYAIIVFITVAANFIIVIFSFVGIEDINYQIYRNLIDSPILILSLAAISRLRYALIMGMLLSIAIPIAFVSTGSYYFWDLPLYAGVLMFFTTLSIVIAINSIRITMEKIKKQEEVIEKQKNELEKANKEKDNIFSIISHDLRGPVGLTKEALEFWGAKELGKEDRTELVKLLTNSTQNTYTLLTNLLTWANSNIGHIPFNPSLNNIYKIIKKVTNSLNPISKQKNILLEATISEDIVAFYDVKMIEIVIRNLLSNAIKFTENNGKIEVTAVTNGDAIVVSIKDNGVGLEKDRAEKLFLHEEVFTTLGTKKEKGSGLGLRICHNFIESNNGKIWVESEIGKGTTVSFSLPQNKL